MNGEKKVTNKVCNENIAKNLLEKVEELLEGKLKHYECCDKKTTHKKFVIEYDYKEKK
tara:strand:+ start:222 stop:395 length:174 start_codon:yes stop_codon:yes gene_type:complete